MKWLHRFMIDSALPIDRDERRLIIKEASVNSWRDPVTAALGITAFIAFMVAMVLSTPLVLVFGMWFFFVYLFLIYLIFDFIGTAIFYFRMRPSVNAAIRARGYDVCLQCGYWLRELGDDITRCPECGAERRQMPESKS